MKRPAPIIFLALNLILLFSGCKRNEPAFLLATPTEEDPFMSAKSITVLFSDSGQVEIRLVSPLMNKYTGEDPRMEFPKGFTIFAFDSAGRVSSSITGNYGVRRENTRIMEARGNVVVRNEIKNEQLNTEQLLWDEPRHVIYTNKPVRITTGGKILFGKGMEADESFSTYIIHSPTGQMTVKQDSI